MVPTVLARRDAFSRPAALGGPFPGQRALRGVQIVMLLNLALLSVWGTLYSWMGVSRAEYTEGEDWEACLVWTGAGRTSGHFVDAAAVLSLNTAIFSLFAAVAADRALRHPSWLLPSTVFIKGMAVSCFINSDIVSTVPVPPSQWATQLMMFRYISLDMYDCLPEAPFAGSCDQAAIFNVIWFACLLLNGLCLLALVLLLHSHHVKRERRGASAQHARKGSMEEPLLLRGVSPTAGADPASLRDACGVRKIFYRVNLGIAVAMGVSMVLELIFITDANMTALSNLYHEVPVVMPSTTLVNTSISLPSCSPRDPPREVPVAVTTDMICEAEPDLDLCGEVFGCTTFPWAQPAFCVQQLLVAIAVVAAFRAWGSHSFSAFRFCQLAAFTIVLTVLPGNIAVHRIFHLNNLWDRDACRSFYEDGLVRTVVFFGATDDDADRYCTDARAATVLSSCLVGFAVLLLFVARIATCDIDVSLFEGRQPAPPVGRSLRGDMDLLWGVEPSPEAKDDASDSNDAFIDRGEDDDDGVW